MARYHAEGVRTVLVCCTGGEAGDILNPAMDRPEVRDRPARGPHGGAGRGRPRSSATTRSSCSATATRACPTRRANADPGRFAKAAARRGGRPAGRGHPRASGPQVIVTYADDQQGYPHPDHLRVHDISVPAFEPAGDPDAYPEAGRAVAAAEALLLGLVARPASWPCTRSSSSSGSSRRSTRSGSSGPSQDDRITTRVDVSGLRRRARRRPAGPRDPDRPRRRRSGSACPARSRPTVHPYDDYILARSLVDTDGARGRPVRRRGRCRPTRVAERRPWPTVGVR